MKLYRNPSKAEWADIVKRPHIDTSTLYGTVAAVLADVRQGGDAAVMKYEEKFDHVRLSALQVTDGEIEEAAALVDDSLVAAMRIAHSNIHKFHASQLVTPAKVETSPGVTCWQR